MLGTRSYDQDFDTSDKSLVTSIQKAINSMEAPVKEKHARVIVIASHKDKTTANYWNLTRRMPLQENAIMAWKFCHVSHKLLRDGYKSAIKESQGSMVLIGELGKLWGHLKEGYGGLIAVYCRLLLQKISFHRKNPQMPGNLVLEDEAFNKMYQHSVDEYFELSVDLLDYLDCILNLQLIVFSTLDHSRCNSMMSNGQCMLAPLLPCVLDSVQLYHYLVHILFKLHSALPASTLQGHRERFTKQYNLLKEFFRKVSSMQYFKNLATVPPLPQSLPDFLKAYELSSHVRPEVVIKDEDEAKNVIPAKDVEEELARLRVVLREKEGMLERAEKEVQEKDKELQRVHDEDLAVLNSMRCKVVELEAEADIQRQISQSTTQENELLKNMLNEKSNLESGKSALEEAVRSSEEKFTKMKDIYSKLRQEHVMTLKKV